MRKYLVSFGIVIVATLIGYVIATDLAVNQKVKEPKTYRENIPIVKVMNAHPQINTPQIKATGRVQSTKKSDVVSEVKGKINFLSKSFQKGQKMKKGELVINIDNTPALHSYLASKSVYYNTVASILPDIKLDYSDDYSKWETYYNAILEQKFPSAVPNIRNPSEKAFITNRGIYQAYYQLTSEFENLKKYSIYAPYDGTISETYQFDGSIINPGAKLFSIISSSEIELVFSVSTEDEEQLKKGNKVELLFNNKKYFSTISRISTFVNQQQQSLHIYVLPPTQLKLRDGEFIEGTFFGEPIENSIRIPRTSLKNEKIMILESDSTVVLKEVSLINSNLDSALVTGPKKDELIITHSPVSLSEGVKVEVK